MVGTGVLGLAIFLMTGVQSTRQAFFLPPSQIIQEASKPQKTFGNLLPSPLSSPSPTPKPTQTLTPTLPQTEPVFEKKVMLLIFNPLIESRANQKLIQVFGWNDPDKLSQDYINDIKEVSHGLVKYVISQRLEIDDIPVKADGFDYTDESYLNCWQNKNCHNPDAVNYQTILSNYQVCEKLNSGAIDELWLWGGPYFGYWEAVMAGPGAFNTNAPPLIGTSCQKKLHIMGFNYERGVSEMLEDLGHRIEGTMVYIYGEDPRFSSGNYTTPWGKFATSDKVSPGKAGCGWMHYAPNSSSDYDWSNQQMVSSNCEDWLNYPHLTGATQQFNCSHWNCDGYQYKKWWLKHIPHTSGNTNGKLNNWWRYVVD